MRSSASLGAALLTVTLCSSAARSFADPVITLEEACASADQTHEKITAAIANEEAATVAPWRAVSIMAPSVVNSGSFLRNKEEIAFPTEFSVPGLNPVVVPEESFRDTITVTQPLYTQQFWALRAIGKAEVERASEATRATRLDIRLAVSTAYYELLRAEVMAQVAQDSARLAAAETRHARDRFELGSALRVDVVRAEAAVVRAQRLVAESNGAVQVARVRLARLANLPAAFSVTEPPQVTHDSRALRELLDKAHKSSPDLQQVRATVKQANAEQRRRLAALLPTLGVQWSYHLTDEETFAERSNFWRLLVGVEIPLLEAGGSRYLDLAEQRAKSRSSEASLAGLERDLMVEVEQAFVAVQTLAAQEDSVRKEADLADESYRLLSEQYTAGVSTSLDVLTALTARALAQSNRAAIHYALATANVQLARLTGELGSSTSTASEGAK
jgi:protease secretion system outer membrane protein